MLPSRFQFSLLAWLVALIIVVPGAAQAQPSSISAPGKHIRVLEHEPAGPHPAIGSDSAPVTFEYFFHVGNQRSYGQLKLLRELARRHPKRLRIIYRLTDSRERSGSRAQVYGREAFEQGRFFEFLEAYYAKRRGPAANKDYPEVAKAAGVDYARVLEALEDMRHDEFLNQNHHYWRRARINSLPALLINGHLVARITNLPNLEALYHRAYEESKKALDSRVQLKDLPTYLRHKAYEKNKNLRLFTGPIDMEPGTAPPKSPRRVRMQPLLKGTHTQGSEHAKLTLVFICHLQSNNCRSMNRSMRVLQKAYQDEVRVIVHPLFDSSLPRQDKAQLLHEAAECAADQGAYWDYYRLAFAKQRQINFDQGFAVDLAESPALDLDAGAFEACLDSGQHAAKVLEEVAMVRNAGVTHVPALAVSGLLYTGRLDFDQLRSLVEAELAAGILGAGVGALDR